jgi:hypothetical protein
MKPKRIHRAMEFNQSPWLKKCIDLKMQMTIKATNDFGSDFYKLMNNSAFGKTEENVRNGIKDWYWMETGVIS